MSNTIINAIPYVVQGDGASTSVTVVLGYAPTSAVFVNAFDTNTGQSTTANVSSISLSGAILTINFVAAFSNLTTVVVNVLPALPVLTTGTNSNVDGIKFTYRAASGTIAGNTITPNFTPVIGQLFQLQGSATKTVRIINFALSGKTGPGNGGEINCAMARRSTAATGGTAITPIVAALDPVDPAATAIAKYWTAAPTEGTIVGGPIQSLTICIPSDANTAVIPYEMDFGDEPGAKAFVLRGVNDFFTVSIANDSVTNPSINFWCEWTEE